MESIFNINNVTLFIAPCYLDYSIFSSDRFSLKSGVFNLIVPPIINCILIIIELISLGYNYPFYFIFKCLPIVCLAICQQSIVYGTCVFFFFCSTESESALLRAAKFAYTRRLCVLHNICAGQLARSPVCFIVSVYCARLLLCAAVRTVYLTTLRCRLIITQYCDAHSPSCRSRIRVFV